ncbi:MAG: hypothetical protein A2277_17885 [Desulfobacterales bacterium RIFOXYA12_FULL_46_15]|nr:MAG: hypothetical protein A2097_07410 [Desulfobacula sp. GWF2_41_7]OGR22887.1 MAG: hypothetical protein A2277_17885 [Desulfobacterales bacterium RIFOXYA12_FULL_46_15]
MIQDIGTFELARLYERQGYYREALDMYLHLDSRETGGEVQAGIRRMAEKVEERGFQTNGEEKISFLFEKWLMLMVLRHRLNNFIKIKKRLS